MERALQNYVGATKEAMVALLAAWEVEREKLSSERQALEEDRTSYRSRLELEAADGRRALERDRAAFERRTLECAVLTSEIAGAEGIEVRPGWEMEREKLSQDRRELAAARADLDAALAGEAVARECRDLEEARTETEREKLIRKQRDLEEDRARLEREAAEGRRAREQDRVAPGAESAGGEGIAALPADRVQLNVGGKHFETTRSTLTAALTVAPASYFGSMSDGFSKGRMQRDGEGRVFIDRNGAMFEYILDFLRRYSSSDKNADFAIRALPKIQMEAMRKELTYYGLESAVFPPAPFRIDVATFKQGSDMLSERGGLGAVILPDNRGVLVVGGKDNDWEYLASTELFDLDSETFSPGPEMGSRRNGCAAAVLEDGQVLVVGGTDGPDTLSTTEVLSPASNTWSFGPNMTSTRVGCAAVPLSTNKILIIGGKRDFSSMAALSYLSTTEIVDLASGISTPGPAMSCPRYCCSAVILQDGRVLVIGGGSNLESSLSTTEVIDLTSRTSSPGPEMTTARLGAAAVLLPEEGGVLVIGGEKIVGTDLATTEVLDVAGNTSSAGPMLGTPRSYCAAVKLPGDHILVTGGYSHGFPIYISEKLGMPAEEGQQ